MLSDLNVDDRAISTPIFVERKENAVKAAILTAILMVIQRTE